MRAVCRGGGNFVRAAGFRDSNWRWSIRYYNDTATTAKQAGINRQAANGGLGEYYSEADTRIPTWIITPRSNSTPRPVSGVGVNSRGAWQWLYGDPGDPEYVTMVYGTVYQAMGWIITPPSQGTTFMFDATGQGMTISVDGFSTF